jgi:ORF6N domain/ORF6C domain
MNLTVLEQNGQRVLTTAQLAEVYGADRQQISKNFTRNSSRYTEGKHYYALTGEQKRHFLNRVQIDDGSRNASVLYLWTEKGAWLHAKSLNTDEAWDAYEMLVDDYYVKLEQVKVLSPEEQLLASMELTVSTNKQMKVIGHKVQMLEEKVNNQITVDLFQQSTLQKLINKRVYEIYNDFADRVTKQKLFSQIHTHIRRAFSTPSYKAVRKKDYDEAVNWIKTWRPLL